MDLRFIGYRLQATSATLKGFLFVSLAVFGLTVGRVHAQTAARSSAFGESVDVRLLPLLGEGVTVQSGPLPVASGSAPPAYNQSNSVASASASVAQTGQILSTGIITVNAASSVPGSANTSGSATVNQLDIDVVELLRLLTIDANTVQSMAQITGNCGTSLTATGSTVITNGAVGGSLGAGLSISSQPGPNTVLLNAGGIRVVLNEQIIDGNGVNSRSITVYAIHITFSNVLLAGVGTLTGEIIIARSHAEVQCPVTAAADLGLSMSASPTSVTVGQNVTFTISVNNGGPGAASNVVVTNPVPSGATLVSASSTKGSCSGNATVSCSLGTLNAGTTAGVTIVLRPETPETLTNTASVSGAESDPNPGNSTASATVTVNPAPATADASISMSASPNPVQQNANLTFAIGVQNGGPSTATGIAVSDALPVGVDFVSATASRGSCSISGGTVTCNLETLADGATAGVTIVVIPRATGPLTNTARVSVNESDPNAGNNTASVSVTVTAPTGEPSQESLFPLLGDGQGLSSTLVLVNPCPTANVTGTVELFDPNGLPLSVRFNGSLQNGAFPFNIPPLGALFFETSGQGDLTVGSVRILSSIPIDGSVIFSGPFGTAGVKSVKASGRFLVPVESNASLGVRTGIAISNPGSDPVVVTLTLRDESGRVVPSGTTTISLSPRSQSSRFLDEIFAGRGIDFSRFKGTLEVSATAPVGGLAIRTSPGEFATLPITTVACDACK